MSRVFEEVKNEGIRIGEIRGKEIGEAIGRKIGKEIGEAIGKEMGREQARLDGIRAIMSSLDLSLTQAMEVLKIPIELREKYSEKLGCK